MTEEKVSWFKMSSLSDGQDLEFELLTDKGTEVFSLWDNNDKKYIRDGEKITTQSGEVEVSKFMKIKELTEDEQKRWRRNVQFVRDVMIGGEQKRIGMPFSAEKKLAEVMETAKGLGQNPMQFSYILSRSKGAGIMQYYVRIGKPLSNTGTTTLANNDEKAVIEAIQNNPEANQRPKEEKIAILIKNQITEERAKELAEHYF